jgi:hypothetical protein
MYIERSRKESSAMNGKRDAQLESTHWLPPLQQEELCSHWYSHPSHMNLRTNFHPQKSFRSSSTSCWPFESQMVTSFPCHPDFWIRSMTSQSCLELDLPTSSHFHWQLRKEGLTKLKTKLAPSSPVIATFRLPLVWKTAAGEALSAVLSILCTHVGSCWQISLVCVASGRKEN